MGSWDWCLVFFREAFARALFIHDKGNKDIPSKQTCNPSFSADKSHAIIFARAVMLSAIICSHIGKTSTNTIKPSENWRRLPERNVFSNHRMRLQLAKLCCSMEIV